MVPPGGDGDSGDERGGGVQVRILGGQMDLIKRLVARTGLWSSATAFVREAVNEKLARTLGPNSLAGEDDEDRPRDVQDVANRR